MFFLGPEALLVGSV